MKICTRCFKTFSDYFREYEHVLEFSNLTCGPVENIHTVKARYSFLLSKINEAEELERCRQYDPAKANT